MIGNGAIRAAGRRRFSGVSAFTAEAVDFDGTTDRLDRLALSGISDGKEFTFSCWAYINDNNLYQSLLSFTTNTTPTWKVLFRVGTASTAARFEILARDSSQNLAVNFNASAQPLTLGAWNHLMCAVDSANGNIKVFVNDVQDTSTPLTNANYNSNYTAPVSIGYRRTLIDYVDGDLSDLWFDNNYLDITVESNRRKFISATGTPVDLGSDGSTPTGSQPPIFFTGAASVWNAGTNAGSGGSFTMTGAVTDSTYEPVELP